MTSEANGSADLTQFRPEALAVYRASSAALSTVSGVGRPSERSANPTLIVILTTLPEADFRASEPGFCRILGTGTPPRPLPHEDSPPEALRCRGSPKDNGEFFPAMTEDATATAGRSTTGRQSFSAPGPQRRVHIVIEILEKVHVTHGNRIVASQQPKCLLKDRRLGSPVSSSR